MRAGRFVLALTLALVLFVLQQSASIGGNSRFADALQNALHVPWFAALTVLGIVLSQPLHARPGLRWTLLLFGLPALAWLTEVVQQFTGRSFEWSDFGRDCLAAAATLAVYRAILCPAGSRLTLLWLGLAAGLFGCALANIGLVSSAYLQRDAALPSLLDPGSTLSRVFLWPPPLEHQPEGAPGASPDEPGIPLYSRTDGWDGLSLREPSSHIGAYAFMCTELDLHSRGAATLRLRVHDFTHERSVRRYEDRFNLELPIAPGRRTIAIPMRAIRDAPRGRKLQLDDVAEILVQVLSRPQPNGYLRVLRIYVVADCTSRSAPFTAPKTASAAHTSAPVLVASR